MVLLDQYFNTLAEYILILDTILNSTKSQNTNEKLSMTISYKSKEKSIQERKREYKLNMRHQRHLLHCIVFSNHFNKDENVFPYIMCNNNTIRRGECVCQKYEKIKQKNQ